MISNMRSEIGAESALQVAEGGPVHPLRVYGPRTAPNLEAK